MTKIKTRFKGGGEGDAYGNIDFKIEIIRVIIRFMTHTHTYVVGVGLSRCGVLNDGTRMFYFITILD